MNSRSPENNPLYLLAQALKRDALNHVALVQAEMDEEAAEFALGQDFDGYDLPQNNLNEWEKNQYRYAIMFWDAWIDNSTHDWRFCRELGIDEWSQIAVEIALALEQGKSYSDELLKKMRSTWED
jgi:hypothetical protein